MGLQDLLHADFELLALRRVGVLERRHLLGTIGSTHLLVYATNP
jgi:hypothetical protein